MKQYCVMTIIVLGSLFMTGCQATIDTVKERVNTVVNALIEKDKQNSQAIEVTQQMVYDNFDKTIGYIKMEWLGLSDIPDFCALLDEADYTAVLHINLSNNDITTVNVDLSCLTAIRKLNLSYNEIEKVVTLGNLPSLKELLLHKNEIRSTKNFPVLPGLEKLSLAYNKLTQVSGLDHLRNLISLELQHNEITKLIGVENLEKLEQLKLEFNKLKDLEFIKELENIELITTKGNQLKEALQQEIDKINKGFLEKFLGTGSAAETWGAIVVD